MEFIAYAHEEGVKTGPESWLGPLLLFAIIFIAIFIGKLIKLMK